MWMIATLFLFVGGAQAGGTGELSPKDLEPYFSVGPARTGAQRFRQGDFVGAIRAFESALGSTKNDRASVELVLALAQQRAGDHAKAAQRFTSLASTYRLLAPYCYYRGAISRFRLGELAEVLALTAQVAKDSPFREDAEHLGAEALRGLGRWADVRAAYARYLSEYPKGIRIAEARFRLAEAAEKVGDRASAIADYDKLVRESVGPWAAQAEERRAALGVGAKSPALGELLAQGKAHFRAQRLKEAERTLGAVVSQSKAGSKLRCDAEYHLGQSIFKQRQRARSAATFEHAATTCKAAQDPDLAAKALYQAARGVLAKKEYEAAAALFLRVEREYPDHRYADDARIRAAEAYAGLSEKDERIDAVLALVASKHPNGDMKSEALFRLAFRALRGSDLKKTEHWLSESLRLVPHESGWAEEGRTLYWMGRLKERQNLEKAARDAYAQCIKLYPLSYYALLAANRLTERDPKRLGTLLGELGKSSARHDWRFAPRPIFAEPAFRRGLELVRLGLFDDARRELGKAGVRGLTREDVQTAKPEAEDDDDVSQAQDDMEDPRWVIALVLDRAGMWMHAHAIPRYALLAWRLEWPTGDNQKRWALAFPRAFERELEAGAREAQIPPELAYAIAREESAFNPQIRSHAQALGLMQLLVSTAKRHVPKGVKLGKTSLFDPALNATCGTRELAALLTRFGGSFALAIAGYNAGPGAVNRWLEQNPGVPLDEFIELIPYDETRGYTKRVLSSFFTYQFLYRRKADPLPKIPGTAPANALASQTSVKPLEHRSVSE